jgi:hypothetical protein
MRASTTLFATASLAVTGFLFVACSGGNDPDTGLGTNGGTGAATGGRASGGKGGGSGGTGGATAGSSTGGSTTGGTGGSTTGGSGGSGTGGSGGSVPSGEACPGLPFEGGEAGGGGADACRGISYEAEPVPVDLFMMMDRSDSMKNIDPGSGLTRWEVITGAVADFIDEVGDQDIRLGLGLFGRTGGNDDALDCDTNFYANPRVEIGDLADVGDAILAEMGDVRPGGLTPTAPALAGALAHAAEWAEGESGRATAVVLVTDGYPTQCTPNSVAEIAAIAEDAHVTEPYVRTYVVGLAADFNLDSIAISGGTHSAYLVDEGDPAASFVAALRNVSNTKLACRYELPPPPNQTMQLDLDEVQVKYTAGDDSVEEVPRIADLEACSRNPNGGWYYDDPANPTQILVCPCTCARFEAGRVDIAVGCRPRVGIR